MNEYETKVISSAIAYAGFVRSLEDKVNLPCDLHAMKLTAEDMAKEAEKRDIPGILRIASQEYEALSRIHEGLAGRRDAEDASSALWAAMRILNIMMEDSPVDR